MARIAVVGAGIVGSACAYFLAREGHDVMLFDRDTVGHGTTSRGEGNILVSDKAPGPELALARFSLQLWRELAADLGVEAIEWEPKGGLVVAQTDHAMTALREFASRQSAAGVTAVPVAPDELRDYEPNLAGGLAGGMWYPDDQQVQPIRAAAMLTRGARTLGARLFSSTEVTGPVTDTSGAITGVEYRSGDATAITTAEVVINATGTWAGEFARQWGAPIPVLPRRGVVLVTEPLPRVIRHKVYTADYVDNVASSDAGLETSLVIEGTRGGTLLIGASRQRAGFDTTISYDVVRILARQATVIFPFLHDVSLLRTYSGLRPYCPDHCPVVGPDPRMPGLYHACGHEGAGIGLAPATASLIAAQIAGRPTPVDQAPLSPQRWGATSDA